VLLQPGLMCHWGCPPATPRASNAILPPPPPPTHTHMLICYLMPHPAGYTAPGMLAAAHGLPAHTSQPQSIQPHHNRHSSQRAPGLSQPTRRPPCTPTASIHCAARHQPARCSLRCPAATPHPVQQPAADALGRTTRQPHQWDTICDMVVDHQHGALLQRLHACHIHTPQRNLTHTHMHKPCCHACSHYSDHSRVQAISPPSCTAANAHTPTHPHTPARQAIAAPGLAKPSRSSRTQHTCPQPSAAAAPPPGYTPSRVAGCNSSPPAGRVRPAAGMQTNS
jgi:hypothetical protein